LKYTLQGYIIGQIMKRRHQKKIIIIAGPNGAGKTTFAMEFLPLEASCPVFVNADLIARALSPFNPDVAAFRAGRIMLSEIEGHVRNGTSFAFETTLSGKTYAGMIEKWRAEGYVVKLFFLTLASAELAAERVAQRVSEGGHNIPEKDIRRRFASGLKNFEELYCKIVDEWVLYDSSGETPILLQEGVNNER
jgi:predicted ABC-type ATPase